MTHTPGPWNINGGPNPLKPQYATIYVKPGDHTTVDHICTIGQHHSKNWQDNAHLIAAAPELLEALKQAVDLLRSYDNVGTWPVQVAAISKAEGKG